MRLAALRTLPTTPLRLRKAQRQPGTATRRKTCGVFAGFAHGTRPASCLLRLLPDKRTFLVACYWAGSSFSKRHIRRAEATPWTTEPWPACFLSRPIFCRSTGQGACAFAVVAAPGPERKTRRTHETPDGCWLAGAEGRRGKAPERQAAVKQLYLVLICK